MVGMQLTEWINIFCGVLPQFEVAMLKSSNAMIDELCIYFLNILQIIWDD